MIEGQARERVADIRAAGDDREFIRGEVLRDHAFEERRRFRSQLTVLQHDSVSRRQRSEHRKQRELDRIVPRTDDADVAEWLT
jgi:hypothetical protein